MNESNYWTKKWSERPLEEANNFAKRAYTIIKEKKLRTLLDLGCGDGRDSIYFSNKGLSVTAVDFSESGIEKLKKQNQEITCITEDIRKVDFAENSFDVIYAHLSLHYFDDETTSKLFDKLSQILKKGGLIFIKCKSVDDALFGIGEKVGENMYKEGHTRHFFSKNFMIKNLKNFKIIRVRKSSSVYHHYKSAFIEAIATK